MTAEKAAAEESLAAADATIAEREATIAGLQEEAAGLREQLAAVQAQLGALGGDGKGRRSLWCRGHHENATQLAWFGASRCSF